MRNNPTADDRSWFEFIAAAGDVPAEILIYDYIGAFGVTAADFDRELKALGKVSRATMRINSPGGETPTAASIYNMLERWKARYGVTLDVVIDGLAASSASWIAMLGDEIIMPENTLMMIHDPSGFVVGTSREMKTMAAVLERIKQGMVSAYVKKSGKDPDEVATIMEEETWYSAQEAVDAGFADRVDNPIEIAASFDLSRFKNPPDGLEVGSRAPVGAAKEKVMTTNSNKQETPAEMEARIRAEVTAEMASKAPAASAAPAAAAAATETPQQMEERIRADVTKTNADINSLCIIAGKPDLAAKFVAEGKTVAEVRAALEALAAAPAPAAATVSGINTHTGAADSEAVKDAVKALTSAPINSADIYKNYNKGKGTPVSYLK